MPNRRKIRTALRKACSQHLWIAVPRELEDEIVDVAAAQHVHRDRHKVSAILFIESGNGLLDPVPKKLYDVCIRHVLILTVISNGSLWQSVHM